MGQSGALAGRLSARECFGYAALWVHAILEACDADPAVAASATHLIDGNHAVAAAIRQLPSPEGEPSHARGQPLVERYRISAAEVMTAFDGCSALNQVVDLAGEHYDGETRYLMAAAEQVVHGWDMARATGFNGEPDAGLLDAFGPELLVLAQLPGGPAPSPSLTARLGSRDS